MSLLTMNEAAQAVPLETLEAFEAGEGGCVRPSVRPTCTLFPHMTLVSSNMCERRSQTSEYGRGGRERSGRGSIFFPLHLFTLLFGNEAALCSTPVHHPLFASPIYPEIPGEK